MKKLIALFGIALMMMSMAFAAGSDSATVSIQIEPVDHEALQTQLQERTTLRNSTLDGFEQVRLRVATETQALQIEQKMNKLLDQEKVAIQHMQKVQLALGENNTVVGEGVTQAKLFGFINMNRNVVFVVSEDDGDQTIERVSRTFDFLFRFKDEIKDIEMV